MELSAKKAPPRAGRVAGAVAASPAALLAGLVLGTALQLQQAWLWSGWSYAALMACALAGAMGLASNFGFSGWGRSLALLLLSSALGFGMTGLRAAHFQASALDPGLEGRDIDITGRVTAMPQAGSDGVRFRFAVATAELDGQPVRLPGQIYLGWYAGFNVASNHADHPATPLTLLELQRQPQVLRAGDEWSLRVRLKAPHGSRNPHGFDYELWLWEQDLQATGYVRAGLRDPPPRKLASGWRHPVERARQSVREAIYARVADRPLAGIVAALVMGDQNAIERSDWDVFRATGVAHLMSISGLHITLFAWLASLLLGALWRQSVQLTPRLCLALPASSAAAWGGLLLAAAYAVFSGWGVPAQRTIWMLAAVVALRQSGRQWAWPHVWLLAMGVVVLVDPWALLQAGFWLSFVAVGVLFASGRDRVRERESSDGEPGPTVPARGRALVRGAAAHGLAMMREQWVVTLALTPLTLLLFNQVSLVGLLANALAIPWVTLVITPLALLGVLWAPMWDLSAWQTGLLAWMLRALANFPGASLSMPSAPLWCALAGVAGGLLLVMRLPWSWRTLGVPLLLPLLFWQTPRPSAGAFELIAADVGQGNAVLLRTANHTLLYDAGPRFSPDSDAGDRVLVPLLRAMGEQVNTLVLSHRDTDHVGGAAAVLDAQPEAQLLSSIEPEHPLQQLRPARRCEAGQRWTWDGVQFEVLHPAASDYAARARVKPNALSCVLRIGSGSAVALLAGDIEAAQERALVGRAADLLRADFLLVPHHGSKTSSSAPFLDAVRPRIALTQAGYRNRFGHPVQSVLARYRERGIHTLQSSVCGAATWRSAEPHAVRCERHAAMRYWRHGAGRLQGGDQAQDPAQDPAHALPPHVLPPIANLPMAKGP